MLLALARVDRRDFVGEAELLQQERDLRGIGRRVEIEADHRTLQGAERLRSVFVARAAGRANRVKIVW